MNVEQFASDDEFSVKFQVVLQTWPLYRTFAYTGADSVSMVPKYLSLFCNYCGKETFWQTYTQFSDREGFTTKSYKCRNCDERSVSYYIYWKKQQNSYLFFKVGQWPELEETVSDTLVNALTPEDLKMYKNALRLRNFNLGIASMAYMRRVVENRMNDMLDVLHEAARAHNAPAEVLAGHEEIKKDKRFSVKVDYAGDLLPVNLRPAGHPNPIAVLHELTSEGLHAKSDAECVDVFDACRQTFEYVFGKMRIEAEEALAFVKGMAELAKKKTKAEEPKPAAKAPTE